MEHQEIKSLQILCDMLIENLTVDECDLDQIQKRLFKMGYNNNSKFNQVFKVMYEKFNEMKANKEMPKPQIIAEVDSSDSESDSETEILYCKHTGKKVVNKVVNKKKPTTKLNPKVKIITEPKNKPITKTKIFDSEPEEESEQPKQPEQPAEIPDEIETEEERIKKTLTFYKNLKEHNETLNWQSEEYRKNEKMLKELEEKALNIQLKVKINNVEYPVIYSYAKYTRGKHMGIIVGETPKFYKIQSIKEEFVYMDEHQTSHYIYVLPTEITGNHYKILKDKYVYKFYIYEDLTEEYICD